MQLLLHVRWAGFEGRRWKPLELPGSLMQLLRQAGGPLHGLGAPQMQPEGAEQPGFQGSARCRGPQLQSDCLLLRSRQRRGLCDPGQGCHRGSCHPD